MAIRKSHEALRPLPGLGPWVGGKRNLAGRLAERIEVVPHHTYAEPFVGMGGVFLRRRRPARNEAINDRSGEVVNLFHVVKHHAEALAAELDYQLFARAEHARLWATDPATLTDVQRAARFYLVIRMGFGGQPTSRSFPDQAVRNRNIHTEALRRQLRLTQRRLARVTIEALDFADFLRRYDRPTTLFYLDPPYWGLEGYYGPGLFGRPDHARLAAVLKALKGRFILSMNDRPEVRDLYGWAKVEEVAVTYKMSGTKRTHELVISTPASRRRAG